MKALVLMSGGVDSSTALGMAVDRYGKENVIALSVSYGQKHDKEIRAAEAVTAHYGVEQMFLDLSRIFEYSNCSLLQQSTDEIPQSSYSKQISETGGQKPVSTYVPFRNGLFLSSAASIALSRDCGVIFYGAHADDAAGAAYPDCSPVFNNAMNQAIWEGSGHQVRIEAPFVNMNKADIVKTGLELGVPYELTWSCYEGKDEPCGKCGTCIDRAAAFAANGVADPAISRVRCQWRRGSRDQDAPERRVQGMSEERVRENEGLTLLGNRNVKYDTDYNPGLLETFENKHQENDYWVKFNCPEFTSLCPITGQPDFATIYISYVPSVKMVESKSLKLYLFSFRNHGDFHEDCVNKIMKDLIRLMDPKYIEVHGRFLPRGGISIDPYCNYGKEGTKWEQIAMNRLAWHDLNPDNVDNR